ncbi:MAG: acyl-CoA dehydrogenase [Myxococcales bacterium]|nr:acyl-CoA dehydrogenase [Myxococcales bacterium]MCB9709445.1 acyl-CoA dehydrogenase [Myxococcales bacterium]
MEYLYCIAWGSSAILLAALFLFFGHAFLAGVLSGAWLILGGILGGHTGSLAFRVFVLLYVLWALVFGIPSLRRAVISSWVMRIMRHVLPRMGETERIALDAGTVWWDGELFSGSPDWTKLMAFKKRTLTDKERAFLNGPVEELCEMLDEWSIRQKGDLPKEIWEFIKTHGFFGMIIPEAYGGLGFSAIAHSAVVTKLSSRSVTAAVTVMVPNSLGPAELLLHYGTESQKQYYLPRLARGQDIPCFALTGPEAGSDAAATQSIGEVCRGQYEGKDVVGMRLNWRKRYITLGPVSTVIGLAFRLRDPNGLLGGNEDLGITCALVPSHLPGINIGERHDPMGVPFLNGPNTGKDVFVPLDFIIGGPEMAGQGWRMLMECLAAGRSISLPALSVGAIELSARVTGAYATVREQFDTPIGRFEGIEEPLARIAGTAYWANAVRTLTASSVDAGEKPAVISAIAKCYLTDAMRSVVNDAMDIRAGAGICRGPRNMLANAYVAAPIGITVEGANILTRSMIIYGQGAIRCHPFVREEMLSVPAGDVRMFDRAFFGHVGFVLSNVTRALVLGLTGGRLAPVRVTGAVRPWLRQFSRMSAAFALVSDVAMAMLGGSLKRREKISGRLADALAWLYIGAAVIKRYYDEGQRKDYLPFMQWCSTHALYQIQQALQGVLSNLPMRAAAWVVKGLIFPWGSSYAEPSDKLGAQVARALLEDKQEREELTEDIYIPPADEPGLGRLEAALDKAVDALRVEARIRDAIRAGRLDKAPGDELVRNAQRAGIITEDEIQVLHLADEARNEVIQVDAFPAHAPVSPSLLPISRSLSRPPPGPLRS